MRSLILFLTLTLFSFFSYSQESTDELTEEEKKIYLQKIDSINKSFTYQHGTIAFLDSIAVLNVPKGYKFLDAQQSKIVLTDLWGNPPEDVLGLLFPEDVDPIGDNFTYAVEVTYSDEGYIDDEDTKNLDYTDLLEQMQEDTRLGNEERKRLGYPEIELVGWASPPFYNQESKKLHWAKDLKFEDYDVNTLNYNIRILGRSGFLNLNAIGDITILPAVKKDVNTILDSVEFTQGNTYEDFDPSIDKVAAYGIGGLIAGKILAKAGFFALLLKFWKFIAIGAVGIFAAFKKKIFGSKEA